MDSFGQLRTWRRPDSMLDVTDTVAVWRPTENGMEGRASQVSLRTRKRGLIAGREVHCAPCNRGEDPISSRTPIALFLRKMPAPISRMSEDRSCPHTCQPRRASRIAVASPAMPAPTISARRPPRTARILSRRGSLSGTFGGWTDFVPGRPALADLVARGCAPPGLRRVQGSRRPSRPVVAKPEHIMLAMSGDLLRTNACVFAHNGILGYPTIRRIELPCRVVPTPALNTQR